MTIVAILTMHTYFLEKKKKKKRLYHRPGLPRHKSKTLFGKIMKAKRAGNIALSGRGPA
jgi:hypothetical protein